MSDSRHPHESRASLGMTLLIVASCFIGWLLLAGIWHTILLIVSLF